MVKFGNWTGNNYLSGWFHTLKMHPKSICFHFWSGARSHCWHHHISNSRFSPSVQTWHNRGSRKLRKYFWKSGREPKFAGGKIWRKYAGSGLHKIRYFQVKPKDPWDQDWPPCFITQDLLRSFLYVGVPSLKIGRGDYPACTTAAAISVSHAHRV